MGWIVRMTVDAGAGEAVTARLWDLGSTGIAEIVPLAGAGPADGTGTGQDAAAAVVELLAGFETEAEARAAVATATAEGWPLAPGGATVEPVDETAWFDPDRRVTIEVGDRQLDLEVGAAFGDGGHPSTRLALDLLAATVTAGDTVLDVGTGTAVLALAARALGAGPITAVDNDPAALAVAARNLARHPDLATSGSGVPDHGQPHGGPGEGQPDRSGDGAVALTAELPTAGTFRVVVANVVLGTQRELAPAVAARLAPGGTLLLAGLLVSQEAEARALHPHLDVHLRRAEGDWLGLALRAAPVAAP